MLCRTLENPSQYINVLNDHEKQRFLLEKTPIQGYLTQNRIKYVVKV